MPKLTAISIANLRPRAKRYEVADTGCPGLKVVVFPAPSSAKSYVLRYRYRGRARKLTVGKVLDRGVVESPGKEPKLGAPMSLLAARRLAAKALHEVAAGTDPCATKQIERQKQRNAESDTLQAVCDKWLELNGAELRTIRQRRSDLKLLCGMLGRLPVGEITRLQYSHALDRVKSKARADRILSAVKTVLNWHAGRSAFISPLGPGGRRFKPKPREHVLSLDEFKAIWRQSATAGLFGSYLRFLFLTATRRQESGGLHRRELSADGSLWTIPAERYKTGAPLTIPLSRAARRIIEAMPRLPGGDYVFSFDGSRPLTGYAKKKRAFDQAVNAARRQAGEPEIRPWRLHDARRSIRTWMPKANIAADVAERALGHSLGPIRGVYDHHDYIPELTAAFAAIAVWIGEIVGEPEPMTDIAAERQRRS